VRLSQVLLADLILLVEGEYTIEGEGTVQLPDNNCNHREAKKLVAKQLPLLSHNSPFDECSRQESLELVEEEDGILDHCDEDSNLHQ
jgi:hypothetical protein